MMVVEFSYRCMFVDADVDVMLFPGFTPLICASSRGKLSVVKHLIELKANVDAKDNLGNTALQQARMKEKIYVIHYLEFVEKERVRMRVTDPFL